MPLNLNINPADFFQMGFQQASGMQNLGPTLTAQNQQYQQLLPQYAQLQQQGDFQNQSIGMERDKLALQQRELEEYKMPLGKAMEGAYGSLGQLRQTQANAPLPMSDTAQKEIDMQKVLLQQWRKANPDAGDDELIQQLPLIATQAKQAVAQATGETTADAAQYAELLKQIQAFSGS